MNDASRPLTPRDVAARTLPVPTTVSPELQRAISASAEASRTSPEAAPRTPDEWATMIAASQAFGERRLAAILTRYPARIVELELGGVTVREILPPDLDPSSSQRVLLHFHGGAYVVYGGRAGLSEAVLMAHHARMRVLSVDYRMPPAHPFPAALDDAVAAWTALARTVEPGSIGVFGTSAGGGLLLALVLRLKALGLPLPGALAPTTPWTDLAGESDSYRVHAGVDGVLSFYDGGLEASGRLYAGGRDLRDPLISPVHGDFTGFPPAILTTGTRDLLLSDTVRAYRAMRAAGVEARLEVHEALSHAEHTSAWTSPESVLVYGDIARWFDRWLAR
jgi:monoterpene epsilon-lactone hydrolase